MPSPEEQKDIDALKAKQIELKVGFADYMISLSRMTPTELMHSGYRYGLKEAYEAQVARLKKSLENEVKSFLKKWPD